MLGMHPRLAAVDCSQSASHIEAAPARTSSEGSKSLPGSESNPGASMEVSIQRNPPQPSSNLILDSLSVAVDPSAGSSSYPGASMEVSVQQKSPLPSSNLILGSPSPAVPPSGGLLDVNPVQPMGAVAAEVHEGVHTAMRMISPQMALGTCVLPMVLEAAFKPAASVQQQQQQDKAACHTCSVQKGSSAPLVFASMPRAQSSREQIAMDSSGSVQPKDLQSKLGADQPRHAKPEWNQMDQQWHHDLSVPNGSLGKAPKKARRALWKKVSKSQRCGFCKYCVHPEMRQACITRRKEQADQAAQQFSAQQPLML